jgi:O-acetyl-ADP-ribose deacetylase (regulator of RNase III)
MDMTKINAVFGDITTQKVEAIVNAANETLLGGGGVDGAIHEAAGPELLEECRKIGGCPTGEARITNGHRLPAEYVIHAVGPVYAAKKELAPVFLAACYKNSLDLVREHLIRSVAFPSISTGAYGYPVDEAAPIAIATVRAWVRKYPDALDEVRFVLHSEDDLKRYDELLHAA